MFESISILTHESSTEVRGARYYLSNLIELWENQGIQVHISGGTHYFPADVALLHVDTTLVEDKFMELSARYPVTINGRVRDISKRQFSKVLLNQNDAYQGPVIVKTDANFGGILEYRTAVEAGKKEILPQDIQRPWRKIEYLDSNKYPVFNNITRVPQGVWRNPKLIVEKFLPERTSAGEFRIRTCLFLGEQEVGLWYASPDPVIKFVNATSRGLLDSVPEALREAREEQGFDYGRFDYTEVDGEVIIFDMNRTPVVGAHGMELIPDEQHLALANAITQYA